MQNSIDIPTRNLGLLTMASLETVYTDDHNNRYYERAILPTKMQKHICFKYTAEKQQTSDGESKVFDYS